MRSTRRITCLSSRGFRNISLCIALLIGARAQAALAGIPFPQPDGPVSCQLLDGTRMLIGGAFRGFDRTPCGGMALYDTDTGQLLAAIPPTSGWILAVASDGLGGWFIGGEFAEVGGIPRSNLAHIRADGSLTGWNPGANRRVYSISVAAGRIFVGGDFTIAGSARRLHLAAIDVAGSVLPWAPDVSSTVRTIAVEDSTVFVGGDFWQVSGVGRYGFAALSIQDGSVRPSYPALATGFVRTLVVRGRTLFVGGGFYSLGGISRQNAASINLDSQWVTAWNPNVGLHYDGAVESIAVLGHTVYLAGNFLEVGGQARKGIAAVSDSMGVLLPWAPPVVGTTHAVVTDGSSIYYGGDLYRIDDRPRENLGAFDAASSKLRDWAPGANGTVNALAVHEGVLCAAGAFTRAGGVPSALTAQVDLTSGSVTPWGSQVFGFDVRAMERVGSHIWVGGAFGRFDNTDRLGLAVVDSSSGSLLSIDPGVNASVNAIAATRGTVFAGGDFFYVQRRYANCLAAFDSATGVVRPWDLSTNGVVHALAAAGGIIFAGGDFDRAGGQPTGPLATIDVATGTVLPRRYDAGGPVTSLLVRDGVLYVGGRFDWFGAFARSNLVAIDIASGEILPWNPRASFSPVYSLASSGSALYAGGDFTVVGGEWRGRLAAIDYSTGVALPWNPTADGRVRTLVAAGPWVYAGGEFQNLGGASVSYYGRVPAADFPTPTYLERFQAARRGQGVQIEWVQTPVENLFEVELQRGPSNEGPFVDVVAERVVEGRLTSVHDLEARPDRPWWYRLAWADRTGTPMHSEPILVDPIPIPSSLLLGAPSPSPASRGASVQLGLPRSDRVTCAVFDMQGRRVLTAFDGVLNAGVHVIELDLQTLAGGIYVLGASSGGVRTTRRLVIVR